MAIGIFSILANVFVLISVLPARKYHNMSNIMLCHLALTDIAISVLLFPLSVTILAQPIEPAFCPVFGCMHTLLVGARQYSAVFLAGDKYLTVARPLCYDGSISNLRALVFCLTFPWIIGVVLASLPFLNTASSYTFQPNYMHCGVSMADDDNLWYGIMYAGLYLYIPILITIICYLHIFRITRRQGNRISKVLPVFTVGMQCPVNYLHRQSQTSLQVKRASWTSLVLLFSFLITNGPYCGVLTMEIKTKQSSNSVLAGLTLLLFHIGLIIDPLVYGVRKRILRESFVRFFRKRLTTISVTPALQQFLVLGVAPAEINQVRSPLVAFGEPYTPGNPQQKWPVINKPNFIQSPVNELECPSPFFIGGKKRFPVAQALHAGRSSRGYPFGSAVRLSPFPSTNSSRSSPSGQRRDSAGKGKLLHMTVPGGTGIFQARILKRKFGTVNMHWHPSPSPSPHSIRSFFSSSPSHLGREARNQSSQVGHIIPDDVSFVQASPSVSNPTPPTCRGKDEPINAGERGNIAKFTSLPKIFLEPPTVSESGAAGDCLREEFAFNDGTQRQTTGADINCPGWEDFANETGGGERDNSSSRRVKVEIEKSSDVESQ